MTQHPPALPPPGISGKRVTLWLVVGLVVIVVSLSYTLWIYNKLDAERAQSARAWRSASESLVERYQAAELGLTESIASGRTSEAFAQEFQTVVDIFRTTSIIDEQVAAAERIEELLGSDEFPSQVLLALPRTAQLQSELDGYNQRREREQVLLKSLGGRILDIFLEFPDSQPFRLASGK